MFARVLDGPAPLVRALRDAEQDQATILRDHPQARPDDLRDLLMGYMERKTRSVKDAATTQLDCESTRGALAALASFDQRRAATQKPT